MTTARELILKAARKRLGQRSTSGLKVQDICALAGISRTSFYREFSNADDVLATITVTRWQQDLAELVAKAVAEPDITVRWRQLVIALALNCAAESVPDERGNRVHVVSLLYRGNGAFLKEIFGIFTPLIERGQVEGIIRTDIFIEYIADWLLRQALAMSSLPFSGPDSVAQMGQYVDQFVLPALFKPVDDRTNADTVAAELRRLTLVVESMEQRLHNSSASR